MSTPLRACVGLLLCLVALVAPAHALRTQSLEGAWEFRQADSSDQAGKDARAREWRKASVPGTVHTDLLANDAIPDPYGPLAEAGLQWIGLADWEYRRSFEVDAATAAMPRSVLVFEGLDTLAEVWLNDAKILTADNAFRTWRVPVAGKLKSGRNTLRVVFFSPIRKLLPQVQAMPHKIAGNYPSPYGDEPKDAMTGNFVRKPGYHYGWDWGPRYVTAGIWNWVRLESWDATRIDDLHIRQDKVEPGRAELTAALAFDTAAAGDYTLLLEQVAPDGTRSRIAERTLALPQGAGSASVPVRIDAPQRWYPVGYGAQPLYRFEATLTRNGDTVDTRQVRTGLRSVELRRDKDAQGQGFAFVINGIPVFAKGANSIPFDMFAPRATDARIRQVLQAAVDANMNMVRSWGGGYYERDAYFEAADELGLLVWQDFMFGGGMQPAYDPAFRANVVAEARDQIRRLRNHPSIVLWCGNNEEEIAWKYWGHGTGLKKADPVFADKVWKGYVQLFGHDLRQVVDEEGGGIAYWPSSPSNDLAEDANKPHSGDMHFWEVWGNPAYPVSKYLDITPRFMSEYGLQAWPGMPSIRSVSGNETLAVASPFVQSRQKFMAGKGNERLLHYIRMEYGDRPLDGEHDFSDFVYLSQVMQAEGIALAALHHRASRPWTMGSLYWQLNDVWPGASWSGMDWFGRPKALHFHLRRAFAPVAVAALRDAQGRTRVSLLSDRTKPTRGALRMRVMDFHGKVLREQRKPVTLAPLSATTFAEYGDADLLAGADPARTLAVFDLSVAGEPASRGIVYFAAAKHLALPTPAVASNFSKAGPVEYTLELHSDTLARDVWIDFDGFDAAAQDNALTLLPGESIRVKVQTPSARPPADAMATMHKALRLRSLADAMAADAGRNASRSPPASSAPPDENTP